MLRLQEGVGVDEDGVDQGVIGDLAAVEIQEVAGALAERSADVGGEHAARKIGLVGGDGVARVESALAVVETQAAADLVAAGLGEDFDAAEAEPVVFGGEGILVDADFANGFLGRKLAAAEAIDVDGAAVGSGAGTGERLQGVGEIVGIVGQGGEVFAAQHERGGVVVGFHAQRGGVGIGDGDLLLVGGHHHLEGKYEIAAGGDVDRLVDGREAGQDCLDGVLSGGEPRKNIAPIGLGLGSFGDAFTGECDFGGGDDGARIVGHGAA